MTAAALPPKAILIVNTGSRVGGEQFDTAADALEKAGLELLDRVALDDPAKLAGTMRDAIARAPMVVVGGGDGTISSAVDHFVGSDCVMGILPFGTANSFARTLGIPLQLKEAVGVIANGRRQRIDLGAIDGDYFANTAVIGLSPLIADSIPPGLKRSLGRLAYLVWACRTAVRFRPFRLTVEWDGSKQMHWATEVRIANGRFFGGVELVPNAELADGRIVVQAITGKSKVQLGRSWLAALFGMSKSGGEVKEFRSTRFRIETNPILQVAIDGEPSGCTPLTVEVAPDAVDVAVPNRPD